MTDKTTTVEEIKKHIDKFSVARGWKENQDVKNLVMALTVESAELAEIFMWLNSNEANNLKDDPKEFEHMEEELADIFWYLCRICDHFNVDLSKAVANKTIKNAIKYPIK